MYVKYNLFETSKVQEDVRRDSCEVSLLVSIFMQSRICFCFFVFFLFFFVRGGGVM